MTDHPKQAPRDEHLASTKTQVRFILWLVGPIGGLGLLLWILAPGAIGAVGMAFVIAAFVALAFYFVSVGIQEGIGGPISRAFGKLLLPSGSSTPPAKPLSHIEAMEARGELAKAAEAYKAEIASDPTDVTSCERLALLSLRRLNDNQTALWAYHEAERRAEVPARKFGYGLLAAGILRDQVHDPKRAVVELRRLVAQYPAAPRIDSLKREIEELKVAMLETPDA